MPDVRHAAERTRGELATGDATIVGRAGNSAGVNSGGTLGNCTLLVTVAGCAECNTHNVVAAWVSDVCALTDIALQAALVAVSAAGIAVAGHT